MKAVIQRVSQASLVIDDNLYASIGRGLMILLGIEQNDTVRDVLWLSRKIAQMRIFGDREGKMNLSVQDIEGEILLVSQFTLLADTKKGNRPSFITAARPEQAIPLYEQMIQELLTCLSKPVQTGVFGADMKINLINDGPVTIVINSKENQ